MTKAKHQRTICTNYKLRGKTVTEAKHQRTICTNYKLRGKTVTSKDNMYNVL